MATFFASNGSHVSLSQHLLSFLFLGSAANNMRVTSERLNIGYQRCSVCLSVCLSGHVKPVTLSSHCTAMAGYLFCRVLTSTPRQAGPGRAGHAGPDTVGRDRRYSVGSTMTLTYSRRMLAASDARISQTADNLPIFERTAIPLYFTCHCRRWFGNLEFSPSSLVWPPYRGTGTADQANLVKLGSAQLNLMSLHSTLATAYHRAKY